MSNTSAKATVRAHPNIALVKYWGKRDEELVLPHQPSFSVTLAPLHVTATVAFGVDEERIEIRGKPAEGTQRDRVLALLEPLRTERSLGPVAVRTESDFPMGAGLASSAAAFAALTVAARAAAGLPPDAAEASRMARRGSGSACRSIEGGFCTWSRGFDPDGHDSFATQRFDEHHWPELRLLALLLCEEEKAVGSRDGMRRTVATSPYYAPWTMVAGQDVEEAERLVERRDLEALGALSERNAWRMHATAFAADPPLCYLRPQTLKILEALPAARGDGLPVWFTLDAGPNPVLLTDAAHEDAVVSWAQGLGADQIVRGRPGGGATLLDTHLF